MRSFWRKAAGDWYVKRNWVKANEVRRLTWPRKWRKYGRPGVDSKRTDRSPEKISTRGKGLLRDGAKRPGHDWQSAIRQGMGRVRRGGSATGPIDSTLV